MASGTEDADTRSNQQATASTAPVGLTNLDSDVSFRPFSVKKKKKWLFSLSGGICQGNVTFKAPLQVIKMYSQTKALHLSERAGC